MSGSFTPHPVLETDYRGYHGMRTKDILGGPKSWGPKKIGGHVKICANFVVLAFCSRRTKVDFEDWASIRASPLQRECNRTILTGLRQA